jgi:hypothetical protein
MGAFCHTSVRQTIDFTAPECDARPKILKKEKAIIKIVVERFEGIGGATKIFWIILFLFIGGEF